jgi:hypothetical protein
MKRGSPRRLIPVAALLLPAPLLAANLSCAKPDDAGSRADEPEEVSRNARETVSSPKGMQAWLRRLVGQYTIGGYVDLCGKGNLGDRRTVTGEADCIATSAAPDVHCKVNISWPAASGDNGVSVLGSVSNLAPAQFLFSIEIPSPGIPMYRGTGINGWGVLLEQVDNKGIGEFASGVLVGETFLATEPCVDLPGNCWKITRITAMPDSDEISMSVEIDIDRQRVSRRDFLLHRRLNGRKAEPLKGSR